MILRPLVVAGMHRSGTSLVASLAAAAGVDMGERLLAPDPANPMGYFEDVSFLFLHQQMPSARLPWAFVGEAFDDQLGWRHLHARDYPRIQVDSRCLIFKRYNVFRDVCE